MGERKLIIRLDGQDHDAGASSLLVYWLNGNLEVIATEKRGADAVVVLSPEQAHTLTRADGGCRHELRRSRQLTSRCSRRAAARRK